MATPVTSDRVALTNSPWAFSIAATRQALGLDRLAVINDFTAQALAIPLLRADERRQIGGGAPVPGQAIGVIGPGTGLGVGGLLPIGERWQPIPARAATSRSPPTTRSRTRSWRGLRRRFGHVSNERVLSGPGPGQSGHARSPRSRA